MPKAIATPAKLPTTSKTFKAMVKVLSLLLQLLIVQQDMMAKSMRGLGVKNRDWL
jgi:hypothetical protein